MQKTVFDTKSDRYLLMILGRDHEPRRVHEDKLWIQRDGTEYGIANELLNAVLPIYMGSCNP